MAIIRMAGHRVDAGELVEWAGSPAFAMLFGCFCKAGSQKTHFCKIRKSKVCAPTTGAHTFLVNPCNHMPAWFPGDAMEFHEFSECINALEHFG